MELKNHKKVIKRIYCQQFCLPIDGLNIVDFSRNDINNFLSHAFDRAEHDDTYSFSQVLAKIVMKCGFDGMVVPGVRATGVNDRYKNVVLFTHDKWITWVDKRYKPELIYDAGISPK